MRHLQAVTAPLDALVEPIKHYKEIYNFLGKSNTVLVKGIAIPFLCTSTLAIGNYFVDQKLQLVYEKAMVASHSLGPSFPNSAATLGAVYSTGQYLVGLYLTHLAIDFATKTISRVACRYVYNRLLKHVFKTIFTEQNLIKIFCDEKATRLKDKLNDDLFVLCNNTSTVLSQSLKYAIQGAIGVYALQSLFITGAFGPAILILPFSVSLAQTLIAGYIATNSSTRKEAAKVTSAEAKQKLTNVVANAESAYHLGAIPAVEKEIQEKLADVDAENQKLDHFETANEIFKKDAGTLAQITALFPFAKALHNGGLTQLQRTSITTAIEKIVGFISCGSKYSNTILESQKHIENIRYILNVATEVHPKSQRKLQGENFVLNDYKIQLFPGQARERSITFKNITIKPGEVCIIKGVSGSGKSTLVSQIAGLMRKKHYNTFGKIVLPEGCDNKNSLVLVTQEDSPFRDWILRKLLFVGIADEHQDKAKMLALLDRFGLNHLIEGLDKKINVSGGEMKRIKLINAILKNPKMLILDESFSQLDRGNSARAKEILKEELPNAIILSICHESAKNDGFHTKIMEFNTDDKVPVMKEEVSVRALGR